MQIKLKPDERLRLILAFRSAVRAKQALWTQESVIEELIEEYGGNVALDELVGLYVAEGWQDIDGDKIVCDILANTKPTDADIAVESDE